MLSRSQLLAAQSEGTFDITVGPIVKLWRRARRSKEMPSPERLAEARRAVGYRYLQLDPKKHTARLLRPGMRLDLGGIGMGYAVDESLALLRSLGITRALLDASGDIGVGDPPPGKEGWKIGIAPYAADAPPSRYLILANAAVTTSGDAFQHVDIGGKRYSHVVDPRTGLGAHQPHERDRGRSRLHRRRQPDQTRQRAGTGGWTEVYRKDSGRLGPRRARSRRQARSFRVGGF